MFIKNEKVFNLPLSDEAYYWAGFLAADGSIRLRYGRDYYISVGQKESDKYHIERFRRFVGVDRQLYSTKKGSVILIFRSRTMFESLVKLGITPNKTFNLKVKSVLECNRHFWRGVVDGDGSVCIIRRKDRKYPSISLSGTFDLMNQFKKFIWCKTRYDVNVTADKRIYRIRIKGRPAMNVMKILYDDSSLSLDRKNKVVNLCRKMLN
jgi:hypothetical protein